MTDNVIITSEGFSAGIEADYRLSLGDFDKIVNAIKTEKSEAALIKGYANLREYCGRSGLVLEVGDGYTEAEIMHVAKSRIVLGNILATMQLQYLYSDECEHKDTYLQHMQYTASLLHERVTGYDDLAYGIAAGSGVDLHDSNAKQEIEFEIKNFQAQVVSEKYDELLIALEDSDYSYLQHIDLYCNGRLVRMVAGEFGEKMKDLVHMMQVGDLDISTLMINSDRRVNVAENIFNIADLVRSGGVEHIQRRNQPITVLGVDGDGMMERLKSYQLIANLLGLGNVSELVDGGGVNEQFLKQVFGLAQVPLAD